MQTQFKTSVVSNDMINSKWLPFDISWHVYINSYLPLSLLWFFIFTSLWYFSGWLL